MACNCNEEGKIINIGMGCCVPVVANADAYYTKSEIDEKLDDIIISGGGITSGEVQTMIDTSIADKADKSEIPTVPTKVSAFENDVPYLTEHQDLSNYALKSDLTPISSGLSALNDEVDDLSTAMENKANKSEIPSLVGYATESYVQGYTYDKATIDEKVAGGGTFDPTQYYNKTQTDALLDEKLDASAYTPTDLTNYYTKSETNSQINSSTADMATKTWVQNQGYLTEHQDLSSYALKSEIPDVNDKLDVSVFNTYSANTNTTINGKQDKLSASSGISITNDEISTRIGGGLRYAQDGTLEVNSTNAIASGNTQVPLSYVVHNYINNNCVLKSKIWCGTQSEYDSITTKDSETIYLIHE